MACTWGFARCFGVWFLWHLQWREVDIHQLSFLLVSEWLPQESIGWRVVLLLDLCSSFPIVSKISLEEQLFLWSVVVTLLL